nr:hypothetical protein [Tanacetum cinerariifolium]
MVAIPDEHLLKFHACKDAKSLWEAIKNSQEGLDETYDRFQKLISQLEIHGEVISQEDANLKLLRSLPSAWNNIALIMRNKSDLDTLSMDALYNNMKVYESEIKSQSSSRLNFYNVTFVSLDNSSSTNEIVNTAHSVFAASFKDQASTASYADDVMLSFFFNQSNALQRGHFARECMSPRNQGNRNRDAPTRNAPVDTTTTNSLVVQDGIVQTLSKDSLERPKTVRSSAHLIEEWESDSEDENVIKPKEVKKTIKTSLEKIEFVIARNTTVENENKAKKPRKSINHLIKDFDFYENKMVLYNKEKNTGPKEIRPVWDNTARVNHQNKLTHSHPKRNFVPAIVLTKSGQVPVNAAKQSCHKAATSISTARRVNTDASRPNVNNELPTTYSYFKAHSPVRRPFNQKSLAKTNNFNEKVNTAKVNNVTTARPKAVVSAVEGNRNNAVKSSSCWIWRPKGNLIDHISKDSGSYTLKRFNYDDPQGSLKSDQGIFNSGCSRHMTGSKSYLINYQEIDGGFGAFGGNAKGGKITGKGKIRTRKLDFEDVYFMKELKFNLFSVSQMCDKKNSVIFTDTKCVVLSPDFKLLDGSQVLLKVPKNNMYNFDLKNVVPIGDLTCLFAKATLNESNLWHRRLSHINFKTMNKLVRGNLVRGLLSKLFENDHTCVACQKGKQHKASCKTKTDETPKILKNFITCIENKIDHKIKTIRCDNGAKFKNRIMNEFYEMKGIRREFSVSRTPRQNGVAERKNRTLIETARTMIADSKLPTTFWAEVIVPGPQYVLLPLLTFDSQGPKSSEDEAVDDAGKKSTEVPRKENGFQDPAKEGEAANTNSTNRHNIVSSPVNVVNSSFTTVDPGREREQINKFESLFRQDKDANGNRMFTLVSAAGFSYVTLGGSIPVNADTLPNADLPTDPRIPDLEDTADLQDTRIFSGAYDDEVEGAVANFNNLKLTTVVSLIPTTMIHKDHLKEQIIGDPLLAPQTRRMTKTSQEHSM